MAAEIRIGRLAKVTQTTPPTIRYYEDIGLLPAPPRPAGNQRLYGEADVRRLTFIRRCREFGFPIDKVRLLVSLLQSRDRSCMEARDLAFTHLTEVRQKLHELQQLERSIAAFVESCDRLRDAGRTLRRWMLRL
jgi:DNA-binding transcriptional MerR regulator